MILNKEYNPKNIKTRYESKNAFITMNSQRDTEEFIRKFQEYSKDNETNIFFNLYRSKVERISQNSYFKKYNNFEGNNAKPNMMAGGKFRKYNDFPGLQGQSTEFPYSSINQMGDQKKAMYKQYNNFNEPQMIPQMMPNMMNPMQQTSVDLTEEEAVGEVLYSLVEKVYPK
jgi:hypothetical protein